MTRTLFILRLGFIIASVLAGLLLTYLNPDWNGFAVVAGAFLIGSLVILVDILLKGFSVRGLTAVSFGLFMGAVISFLVGTSPFFEPLQDDPDLEANVFLVRLVLFCALTYIGSVIALRGKDELNLVIPYVRFSREEDAGGAIVVDTSALVDGRLAKICRTGWMGFRMVVPQFVIDELQRMVGSGNEKRRKKGRLGLATLNEIRKIKTVDLQITDSVVEKGEDVEAKLLFLAESTGARLLTTDVTMARLAEIRNIRWLSIPDMASALQKDVAVGDELEIELVKTGKESHQGVGFLSDGSMVVVAKASEKIGGTITCEVESILPTTGGKMIFAKWLREDSESL